MNWRYHIIPGALIALALCIYTGCGSSGDTLADVDGYKLTTQEFNDYIANVPPRYSTAQEEFDAKRDYLDSLVVQRLLIQEAYKRGIDKMDETSRVVLANRDRFMLDILYQRNVIDKAKVTEAEVRDFYNKQEYRIKASHILLDNVDTANALVERILAGENFGQLAYDYSLDPAAKRNKGDLGFFTWGAMVQEFQEAAYNMEPGEVSPPVKSPYGYHIIKVVAKEKNPAWGDYDSMKAQIEEQVSGLKRGKLTKEYVESIRDKYAIKIDKATLDYLEHKRENLYPPQILATLPANDFDLEQLDRNERELVLATWEGGQMTLHEYLTQARQIPDYLRPDFTDPDSIATIVFNLKANDLLVLEANQQGVENDPQFTRKLSLFKELAMADIMRNDSLPQPPPPEENVIRMYYEKHPEEFTDPAKIHIYEIFVSDEMLANKLAREIKTLSQFKKKAAEYTERPAFRGTNGDLDYVEERWFPNIFPVAWKTPNNSLGGPVANRGKYSIFWVVDKIPAALKDYLGQKRTIVTKLTQDQKSTAFSKWVDDQMATKNVTIYDDALWKTIDKASYAVVDTTGGN